jgi:hypothetical protein
MMNPAAVILLSFCCVVPIIIGIRSVILLGNKSSSPISMSQLYFEKTIEAF